MLGVKFGTIDEAMDEEEKEKVEQNKTEMNEKEKKDSGTMKKLPKKSNFTEFYFL